LRKEIKTCEKIQNEQSKELMKVNEEADFYYKIKSLSEELRVQKIRYKESHEKINEHKEKNEQLKDRLRELEAKLSSSKNGTISK